MKSDNSFVFWKNWLILVNLLTVVIGILIAFFGNSLIFEVHNTGTKKLFFGGADFPTNILLLKNWLFGIIGATIAGFHILVIFIAQYAFAKKQKWARNAIALAMATWFVIDSSLSLYHEAYYNVYFINIPSFVLITLPLIMTWKKFDDA